MKKAFLSALAALFYITAEASFAAAENGAGGAAEKGGNSPLMVAIAAVVCVGACVLVFLKFRRPKYPWQMTSEEREEWVKKKRPSEAMKLKNKAIFEENAGKDEGETNGKGV